MPGQQGAGFAQSQQLRLQQDYQTALHTIDVSTEHGEATTTALTVGAVLCICYGRGGECVLMAMLLQVHRWQRQCLALNGSFSMVLEFSCSRAAAQPVSLVPGPCSALNHACTGGVDAHATQGVAGQGASAGQRSALSWLWSAQSYCCEGAVHRGDNISCRAEAPTE